MTGDTVSISLASKRVTIVGGANTDIVGRSTEPLVAFDSNPGEVRLSRGGVARNIAENLARLGAHATLVTAFGSDAHGRELESECRRARIDTSASLVCADTAGSVYVALLDEQGDMVLAVNDMRALDRITPRMLQARRGALDSADLLVVDTNIPVESLEWLVENASSPIAFDLVSAAKAPRVRSMLAAAAAVKCNAIEAAALFGAESPEDRGAVEALGKRIRREGTAAVFVTAGALGAHYRSEEGSAWVPAPDVEIVNATGAGDAFTAGVVAGLLANETAAHCAELGSWMAAITLASFDTVSDAVGPSVLREAVAEWEA
jgi:pseudouridine kinase